jgi:hypothetical protein
MKAKGLILFFLGISTMVQSQNYVREQDVLFRKHLVRAINLKDPQNIRLFGEKALLSAILLDAYEKGKIPAYRDRTCEEEVNREDIESRIISSDEDTVGFLYPHVLTEVELGEDILFDKHRSEFAFDQKYIAVLIPESVNYRGIKEVLAYFKYSDCVKAFKQDERAFSLKFSGVKVPFNELFLAHSYKSYIVKIGDGDYFDQLYADPVKAFIAGKHQENLLIEQLYKFFNPQ